MDVSDTRFRKSSMDKYIVHDANYIVTNKKKTPTCFKINFFNKICSLFRRKNKNYTQV
jgi:hypothetical protein